MGILNDIDNAKKKGKRVSIIVGIICIVFLLAGIHFRLNSLEHSGNFELGRMEGRSEASHYLLHRYGEAHVLKFRNWLEKEDAK